MVMMVVVVVVVVDERSQMVELCKEGLIHEVKCCPGLGG
jgi:hypothetical protein